jgi:hypothetical protein
MVSQFDGLPVVSGQLLDVRQALLWIGTVQAKVLLLQPLTSDGPFGFFVMHESMIPRWLKIPAEGPITPPLFSVDLAISGGFVNAIRKSKRKAK